MTSTLFPDPLQMWRDAIGKLETDANALAAGGLKSPEVMRTLRQSMAVSSGMQQAFEKLVEAYLNRVDPPSRQDLVALAESLQRIEEKLDRLLPAQEAGPRPARTRQPPVAPAPASAPAPAPAPEPAAHAAPAAPARKRAAKPAAKAPARRAAKG